MLTEFDPNAPLVGPDGLEYETLCDYLAGNAIDCPRNEVIRGLKDHPRALGLGWGPAVRAQYLYQSREGGSYACTSKNVAKVRARLPQDLDRHFPATGPEWIDLWAEPGSSGAPEGDGSAGAVPTPADPVHAAH